MKKMEKNENLFHTYKVGTPKEFLEIPIKETKKTIFFLFNGIHKHTGWISEDERYLVHVQHANGQNEVRYIYFPIQNCEIE